MTTGNGSPATDTWMKRFPSAPEACESTNMTMTATQRNDIKMDCQRGCSWPSEVVRAEIKSNDFTKQRNSKESRLVYVKYVIKNETRIVWGWRGQ